MFVKGEHERQFAYEAHTVFRKGFVLGAEVTAGHVHDSVAWYAVYDRVTEQFDVAFAVMDAGYKTPWIAKKVLDDGKAPILPYTRYHGKRTALGRGTTPITKLRTSISVNHAAPTQKARSC